jgi:hypothetical protein
MDAEADIPATTRMAGASAVSWGAIIAGTAVAVATSLLLFTLAAGLDLGSISSWPHRGISRGSLTVMTAVALLITQWIASSAGGYIAGRLRTRWVGTHTHEVFFRDTAHGFITWCMATIIVASGVLSLASPFLGMARAGDTPAHLPAGSHPNSAGLPDSGAFRVSVQVGLLQPRPRAQEELPDGLVLPSAPPIGAGAPAVIAGASVDDPAETGTPDAADTAATRAAATGSFVTALAMLIGAFVASVSAVLGGRRRDLHP